MNTTVAIISAAGVGTRMHSDLPKQFLSVGGKTILDHTISVFQQCPQIQDIIVVAPQDCKHLITAENITVVEGGPTRQVSVYNGLKAIDTTPDFVAIHDGVRCLIRLEDIQKTIEACVAPFDGSVLAHPVRDTLKKVMDDTVVETISRENLWAVQTPQVFFYKKICAAYEKAMADDVIATDDVQVMQHIGGKIKVVYGPMSNIKITYPEDLQFLAQQGSIT